MKTFLKAAAALAIAGATATAADAAVVTKTYSVTSTFDKGFNASITQKFTLEFDPVARTTFKVSDYTSSVDNVTAKIGGTYRDYLDESYGQQLAINQIHLFYDANGNYHDDTEAGYGLVLSIDAQGNPLASLLNYSDGRGLLDSTRSLASLVTTPITPGTGPGSGGPTPDPVTGAVPEPATWAMMLVGFGGIGFAMRRRKSKVTTTVAYA